MKEEQVFSKASTGDEWSDFERSLEVLLKNRRESSTSEHPPLSSPAVPPTVAVTSSTVASVRAMSTPPTIAARVPSMPPTSMSVQPNLVAPSHTQNTRPGVVDDSSRIVDRRPAPVGLPASGTPGRIGTSYTNLVQQSPRFRAPLSLLSQQRRPTASFVPARAGSPSPSSFVPARAGTSPPSSFVPARAGIPPPSSFVPARAGNSPPLSFVPARAGTSPPSSFVPIRAGTTTFSSFVPARAGIPPPSSFVPAQVGIPPLSYPQPYLPLPNYTDQVVYPYYPPPTTQDSHPSISESSYSTYPIGGTQQQMNASVNLGGSLLDNSRSKPPLCDLCPSPFPFNETEVEAHGRSHEEAMFQCAGCGHRHASYFQMESHVQAKHVGNDQELIKLSIIIPNNPGLLKVFKCGIKTCGRRFNALTEGDLKKHIGKAHGEFYIHMGHGRNILRLCRLCSEEKKFASDEDLTSHILTEHPPSLYANGECRSILPGSQQIPVLLNQFPQPLSKPFSPQRLSNARGSSMTGNAVFTTGATREIGNGDSIPMEQAITVEEKRKITILRRTPERDPDGSVINDRKRKRISSRCHNLKDHDESTTDDNEEHDTSSKRTRKSKTKHKSKYEQRKRRKEMSFSLSLSPNDVAKNDTRNAKDKLDKKCHGMKKKYETEEELRKSSSKFKSTVKPVAATDYMCPTKMQVYCEACNYLTSDWSMHKHSYNHAKNEKKSRCYFCPGRLWFPQLKSHISTHHENKSFVCKAVPNCVQLMGLNRMVDHINVRHQRELEPLFMRTDTNYASPVFLAKHGFMSLPDDLRKLTCKICNCQFLAQDKKAIVDHFTLDHKHLADHQMEMNILYECRACEAMLFGSEKHLLRHLQNHHHRHDRLNVDWPIKREESYHPHKKSVSATYRAHNEKLDSHQSPRSDHFSKSEPFRPDRMYRSTSYHEVRDWDDSQKYSAPNIVQRFKGSFNYSPKNRKSSSSSWYPESTSSWYPESVSPWYPETNPDVVEACPFCDKRLLMSRQSGHQQTCHADLLFSCDSFCTLKFKSAWKSEVLSHLKDDHLKMKSDEMLMRHYLRLPNNLKMICCKISSCDAAVYLGRSPNEMREKLKGHVDRHHLGKTLNDCYTLACRGCGYVAPFNQEEAWLQHFDLDHSKKDFCANQAMSLPASSIPLLDNGKDRQVDAIEIKEETSDCAENDEKIIKRNEGPITVRGSQCRFCTKMLLKTEEQDHALEHHVNKLFHCEACEDVGEVWASFSVEDLVSHLTACHVDRECKVSAPPDGDVVMSVCSVCAAQFYTQDPAVLATHLAVCAAQFYTQDPAVLATHLAHHDMAVNLAMFQTFCRLCGAQLEKDHFRTAHEEEYRCCVEKIKSKSSKKKNEINLEEHSGNRTDADFIKENTGEQENEADKVITRRSLSNSVRKGKVVKVQHNPKEIYEIVDLKEQITTPVKRRKSKEHGVQNIDNYTQKDMSNIEDKAISNQELIKEQCLYCLEEVKSKSLPFHVLTQHKKLTFRCTMCSDSKIKKLANKICFNTLDGAGQHMNEVHNIDLTVMKFEASVKGREGGSEKCCSVQPLVKVYCPGLSVPADLKKWECNNCTLNLFSVSSL